MAILREPIGCDLACCMAESYMSLEVEPLCGGGGGGGGGSPPPSTPCGSWWNCVECGAVIALVIACCVGTLGKACLICAIASGILAVCPCMKCCGWLGNQSCCDAANEHR